MSGRVVVMKLPSPVAHGCGLLWFHINFCIICSSSVKNTIGILTEIALGSMEILMVLILPIHDDRIDLYLLQNLSSVF